MSVVVNVSPRCPSFQQWPFLAFGLIFNIGLIVLPIIGFYIRRTNDILPADRDLQIRGYKTKFPSISKAWRNRNTVWMVLGLIGAVVTAYNICIEDAAVLALIDVFAVLLLVAYFINPETKNLAIPWRGWDRLEGDEKRALIRKLSIVHLFFAAASFLSIWVVEVLVANYYYDWNGKGIGFFVADSVMLVVFVLVYAHEWTRVKEESEKKGEDPNDREWTSAIDLCEVLYCLLFGFTLMFVENGSA